MARPRSPKSKKTREEQPRQHDSLAVTRAAPALDELAATREGEVVSRYALLDAGQRMIADTGYAAMTVEDVAHQAGVSTDVFQAHFADKGALLRALNERFVHEMIGAVDASTRTGSWSTSRVRDVVEIAVRTIMDVVDENKALVRTFIIEGASDRALATGLSEIGAHMTSRLVAVLGGCRDAKQSPPTPKLVGFSLVLSVALAHQCLMVGEDWAGIGLTRHELTEELARAISAYLVASRPS